MKDMEARAHAERKRGGNLTASARGLQLRGELSARGDFSKSGTEPAGKKIQLVILRWTGALSWCARGRIISGQ